MRDSVRSSAAACQGSSDSLTEQSEGKGLSLALLREAIGQSGWKHDALAVQMKLPNAAYLSRMLSGEKPWTLRHIESLPDDIEAIYYRLRGESLGLVVVAPLSGRHAVEALVAGLIGVLGAPRLPERADGMAKAELPTAARRRA